ncbi:hypothetical protein [Natronorubrum thiooxidans]|nr:hypothetical protein [Natronorubrum thiooxidans]
MPTVTEDRTRVQNTSVLESLSPAEQFTVDDVREDVADSDYSVRLADP